MARALTTATGSLTSSSPSLTTIVVLANGSSSSHSQPPETLVLRLNSEEEEGLVEGRDCRQQVHVEEELQEVLYFPQAEAQRRQYLLAMDLGHYTWYQSHALNLVVPIDW